MKISGIVLGMILAFSSPALAQTKAAAEKPKAAADKAKAAAEKQKAPQKAAAQKDSAMAGKDKEKAGAAPVAATPDAEVLKKEQLVRAKVSADQRAKVDAVAKALPGKVKAAAKATPDKPMAQVAREVATAAGLGGKDIDALVFLVVAQATRNAQEDLKAATASVKAVNAAKLCKDNACLAAMKPSADYDQKTLDILRSDLKGVIDGVSDLGQQLQLALQEATNIYTRTATARADVAKKYSDSQDSVAQNIK